jgi:exopolyphosphatase/guanosine-5'-triphosphate,3'-diphosphate pyrophosphatase
VSAAREIEAIAVDYQRFGWQEAVGSSGSAQELADHPRNQRAESRWKQGNHARGAGEAAPTDHPGRVGGGFEAQGMRSERLPILPGAIAIMSAVFSELAIEQMTYSDGALPLGVLYDLLGRFAHHDTRDETVVQFMRRYRSTRARSDASSGAHCCFSVR